jgi:hypothetical protein
MPNVEKHVFSEPLQSGSGRSLNQHLAGGALVGFSEPPHTPAPHSTGLVAMTCTAGKLLTHRIGYDAFPRAAFSAELEISRSIIVC